MGRPKIVDTKPVSFRLPVELVERIEEAKWDLRMNKVDVVKYALEEFLDRHDVGKKEGAEVSGELRAEMARLSEPSFARVWDNDEDAVYDQL